tara:strand:- start:16507 stop:17607 length:1101 start_codon:yes stop_codon:yes gene_type:complete
MQKKIFYIADFSLPNMSAYTLHVLKMCDAFSELGYDLELLIPHVTKDYKFKNIKKDFILKSKYKIVSLYNRKKKLKFLTRIFFSFKILKIIINQKISFIYSRSIIPALIISLFNFKVILEIHTEMTGFTKFFFKFLNPLILKKNLKLVLINKKLNSYLGLHKKKYIVLDDAVDIRDFKKNNHYPIVKNTCFYSGSFVDGKGIEIIRKIAFKLPNINFHLYGNINTLTNKKNLNFSNNVIFKGFLSYNNLTKKMHQYKILLMPYKKKVGVLMQKTSVEKYFSPLKMFDYLASGKLIIASNLKVYKHILKNKFNSLLVNPDDINDWVGIIKKNIDSRKLNYIGKNAIKTSKNYQWLSRAKQIINYNEK